MGIESIVLLALSVKEIMLRAENIRERDGFQFRVWGGSPVIEAFRASLV
jgi:hypothetical protein